MKRPLRQRTFAGIALCLCALSCKVPTPNPTPSLVVIDVDGFPPTEGFVLLVKSTGLDENTPPLGVEVVDDTLHWNSETGTVLPTQRVPAHAQWAVFSPDPLAPDSWRHVRMDVSGRDTCQMSSLLPVDLDLRLSRTLGSVPDGYSLCFSDVHSQRPDTLPLEGFQGRVKVEVDIPFQRFPVRLSLLRHQGETEPRVVASHIQESVPLHLPMRLHWFDRDEIPNP
jgi:hypothetical protein